jgi:RNA-binding protein
LITSKQRSCLRRQANEISAIFQIGKGGIGENMIQQINEALDARELVKINVLKSAEADVRTLCEEVVDRTGSDIIQIIGNKFTIYREAKEKDGQKDGNVNEKKDNE